MIWLNTAEYNKRSSRAFTLIELMIVIVVISILVGITIPIAKYVSYRARLAQQRIYIEKIKSALEDYRAAYGEYPITPNDLDTSGGDPLQWKPKNYNEVLRHYSDNFATTIFDTNSPYANVNLADNTVEAFTNVDAGGNPIVTKIDYCLTYPLMYRQLEKGARPFMDFKPVTVAYLFTKEESQLTANDINEVTIRHKTKSGGIIDMIKRGVFGNPVDRAEAIDPLSRCQWKYTSEHGVTYDLSTNSF